MKSEVVNRHLPIVAIVGRPNVGKSTLFNRITGKRKAVVHDTPGLTRDRNYLSAEWEGRTFLLVDTGGYETETSDLIYKQMREQTMLAVDEADAIIFLTSVEEPLNPTDDEVMKILRRANKPVFVAVNKTDSRARRDQAYSDFARFGVHELYPLTALHGTGVVELLDEIVKHLPEVAEEEEPDPNITRIAVVGHPNVGKSTLVNRILGYERVIASPVPGTTRDPVDTTFVRDGKQYMLIDTAGIRRRGKISLGAEKLSVVAAIMSMERCDIALLVIDAELKLTDQDEHIAGYAVDAGCGCIVVVNKWDLLEKETGTAEEFTKDLRDEMGFLKYAPIIYISAKTGQRVEKLFALIDKVYEEYNREIETGVLNDFLKKATAHFSPPVQRGRQLSVKYVTQTGTRPPTFTFFVNDPKLVHFSYERYLANQLRKEFGFEGVPLRLRFRQKSTRPAPPSARPTRRK